ncbi:MAG: M28 family peptidase [Intrasporangium sp.]|uniref:M28 family metallopeptidase n=1 Tax=Intrasporangium sp. TaxID=1925024 RepID=UPI0026496F9C|nr:M28 family peptidase [Intrasporangium sp.]MDN5796895.1 M28 family peptidase [Intrasporangium sp.]
MAARPAACLRPVLAAGACLALLGCMPPSSDPPSGTVPVPPASTTYVPTPGTGESGPTGSRATTASSTIAEGSTSLPATPSRTPARASFDTKSAHQDVAALARIGPRDAVSRAYARAAAYVQRRFEDAGYTVQRQSVPMPAGVSWGVAVSSGTTTNVVADPPGFDPRAPHVVIGAHLDTVPQAPGAEDNASGVAVLIGLARMLAQEPAGLPVRLVAFGGEEARGGNGTLYAFGSRHYAAALSRSERRAIRGMVALDRVGVEASSVPVCAGMRGTEALAETMRSAARRAGIATHGCRDKASDHVSFEAVGIPVARLGKVPYAAYHSRADTLHVVDSAQLGRTAGVVWAWLRSLEAS